MAITFPLALAAFIDLFTVEDGVLELARFEESSGTARGQRLTRQIAAPKWRGAWFLGPTPLARAGHIKALVERLGSDGTFYAFDPWRPYPLADPRGILLGSSAPTIHSLGSNNRSMRLAGLPSGYFLAVGDMLAFDRGADPVRRSLHRIVEAATASAASVTPMFEVEPHLQAGTVAGATVTLRRAAAKMQLTGFSAGRAQGPNVGGMSLTAEEAF